MQIPHLVRVIKNNTHQLSPENYKFCPRFTHDNIKVNCLSDKNNKCFGLDEKSIVKNISGDKFLLQCNYWCD